MRALDVLSFWSGRGLDLDSTEGFRFGSPHAEITGALVCWLPNLAAIRAARQSDCNLIIAREQFSFPPTYSGAVIDHHLSDRVTLRRMRALNDANIIVFRAHKSLDAMMLASLAHALELAEPQVYGDALRLVYGVDPVTGRELARRVKRRLGLDVIRVCGDLERVVRRVALLWSDTGSAHNVDGFEPMLRLCPDAVITGQTDDYPMRAAIDAGVTVIEAGQSRSVAPGLRRLTVMLRGQFPGLPVTFYENPRPWSAV